MTIDTNDIKALHLDMAQVLNDAEYVIRHLKGQRKVQHLVEQDVRHLRDQLARLAKHIDQLQQLHSDNRTSDDDPDSAIGIGLSMRTRYGDTKH